MGALLAMLQRLPEWVKIAAIVLRYLPTIVKLLPVAAQMVREIYAAIAGEAEAAKSAPSLVVPITQPPQLEPASPKPAEVRKEKVEALHEAIAAAGKGDWRDLARIYIRARQRG